VVRSTWRTVRRLRAVARAALLGSNDHSTRVGRPVSSQHTASRRRVEAALAGHLATGELTIEEGVVFNAEISAAIEESLARSNYGATLAGQGISTVALNGAGAIVEYRTDGSSVVLAAKR
jgi:hypothetical protein